MESYFSGHESSDVVLLYWLLLSFLKFSIEDEPGKQARSAVRIKNISKSHVAFKVGIAFCTLSVFMWLLNSKVAVYMVYMFDWPLSNHLPEQAFINLLIINHFTITIFLTQYSCFSILANIVTCVVVLVSNDFTKKLFYASSWGHTFSWREYHSNWYYKHHV